MSRSSEELVQMEAEISEAIKQGEADYPFFLQLVNRVLAAHQVRINHSHDSNDISPDKKSGNPPPPVKRPSLESIRLDEKGKLQLRFKVMIPSSFVITHQPIKAVVMTFDEARKINTRTTAAVNWELDPTAPLHHSTNEAIVHLKMLLTPDQIHSKLGQIYISLSMGNQVKHDYVLNPSSLFNLAYAEIINVADLQPILTQHKKRRPQLDITRVSQPTVALPRVTAAQGPLNAGRVPAIGEQTSTNTELAPVDYKPVLANIEQLPVSGPLHNFEPKLQAEMVRLCGIHFGKYYQSNAPRTYVALTTNNSLPGFGPVTAKLRQLALADETTIPETRQDPIAPDTQSKVEPESIKVATTPGVKQEPQSWGTQWDQAQRYQTIWTNLDQTTEPYELQLETQSLDGQRSLKKTVGLKYDHTDKKWFYYLAWGSSWLMALEKH